VCVWMCGKGGGSVGVSKDVCVCVGGWMWRVCVLGEGRREEVYVCVSTPQPQSTPSQIKQSAIACSSSLMGFRRRCCRPPHTPDIITERERAREGESERETETCLQQLADGLPPQVLQAVVAMQLVQLCLPLGGGARGERGPPAVGLLR
jgi:hypothetical protein